MDKENNYLQYYEYQELLYLADDILHRPEVDPQITQLFYLIHEEINRRENMHRK